MNKELISEAMMERLKKLEKEDSCLWSEQIERYGLGYEVAMSSGLTLEQCTGLSDQSFLEMVDEGMGAWDI